jgi:hypothetical protein
MIETLIDPKKKNQLKNNLWKKTLLFFSMMNKAESALKYQ